MNRVIVVSLAMEYPLAEPIHSNQMFYSQYFGMKMPACQIDLRCRMQMDAIKRTKPMHYFLDATYKKLREIQIELRMLLQTADRLGR